MKIGEMSDLFKIPRETIRFYEREGLMLPPNRNNNNYRSYSENHVERLRFIKNCRNFNMSHREIKKLLNLIDNNNAGCELVEEVVLSHLSSIRENIEKLKRLEKDLVILQVHSKNMDINDKCGIIKNLLSREI
ncbi:MULTISPECIES: MerR family transcriptional regulator [unclassified Providencia]|uniref:MerR family transcriptional regulator n=1 Tax=unclassified Providencia TaxID=2633465 RepID=UPI000E8B6E76|nr:MerR family transcriptional regulator [Providencia sp.]MBP6080797.1 MerR family transcriptional regulator [Providencia sp.]HBO21614.1 MerR family transcriptional regulator [Providencia sp.]